MGSGADHADLLVDSHTTNCRTSEPAHVQDQDGRHLFGRFDAGCGLQGVKVDACSTEGRSLYDPQVDAPAVDASAFFVYQARKRLKG